MQVPRGRQCELVNRAATIFPVAGTRYNNVVGDDLAAATAKIPDKSCEKPDRPQCEPGTNELRSESGACVCKTGYMRDRELGCVRIIAEPARCPDGTPVPKNGRCPGTTPKCDPGPNEFRNDDNRCVCKSGYERNDRGLCVAEETPLCEPGRNEYRNDKDQCVCKRGYERDKNGRCVDRREAAVRTRSKRGPRRRGHVRVQARLRARQERPMRRGSQAAVRARSQRGPRRRRQCVCKRGYERDKNGRCVEETKQCQPGPNEVRDDKGQCVCKRGYERDKNGRCVTDVKPQCEPGPNEVRDDKGQCVCKGGYERDKNGRCVRRSRSANPVQTRSRRQR